MDYYSRFTLDSQCIQSFQFFLEYNFCLKLLLLATTTVLRFFNRKNARHQRDQLQKKPPLPKCAYNVLLVPKVSESDGWASSLLLARFSSFTHSQCWKIYNIASEASILRTILRAKRVTGEKFSQN